MTVGIGFSIFLFVIGAILTFAVEVDASGFNINTVGIILMVGGLLGPFASLLSWNWGRAAREYRQRAAPPASCKDNPGLAAGQTVVDAASPCAAARFPGEPAWGVRLKVMSVLYWY